MTRHHINLIILAVIYLFILAGAYVYADHEHACTTDSDCGCQDDCLEPMPDEADTTTSKERN